MKLFFTEEEAVEYTKENKLTGFLLLDLEKLAPAAVEAGKPSVLLLEKNEFKMTVAPESLH